MLVDLLPWKLYGKKNGLLKNSQNVAGPRESRIIQTICQSAKAPNCQWSSMHIDAYWLLHLNKTWHWQFL